MWSDNETTDDLIGFQVHADLIREVILDRRLLPVTIGVFGDWGSGKSSIMQMLKRDLSPESQTDSALRKRYEKTAVLYFNGWLFEGYDDAKSALLSSIIVGLAEHQRFGPKIRDKAAKLIKRVNWMRVARLGFTEVALPAVAAYVSGGLSAIPSLARTLGGSLFSYVAPKIPEAKESEKKDDKHSLIDLVQQDADEGGPTDVRSFRDEFAKMLKESDIETLVVLIDDLDRCSPERIIDNLEAIKLFLNVDGTAFVIGADPRMVRHAISIRYKEALSNVEGDSNTASNQLISDYLEKLIQVPYHLPRLSPAEIHTYMSLLFCRRDLPEDQFGICLKGCTAERERNRYQSFGFANVKTALGNRAMPAELATALVMSAGIANLITEGLKGNPRQVKRFLNAFFLRRKLADVAQLSGIRDDVLVKLMLLEYADSRRFRLLFETQASEDGFPKLLEVLESEEQSKETASAATVAMRKEWDDERIRRWALIDPKLKGIDLRDYFWLARDRLESTLGALTMVSPIVRRVLDDLLSDGRRKAAAKSAQNLSADERESLHALLKQGLRREPTEQKWYGAFRALLEEGLPSHGTFAEILLELPIEKIPPSIPPILELLQKQKPEMGAALAPVMTRFASAKDSKVGRAAAIKH